MRWFVASLVALAMCARAASAASDPCATIRPLPGTGPASLNFRLSDCYGQAGDTAKQIAFFKMGLHESPISMDWLNSHNYISGVLSFTALLARNEELGEAQWWWRSIDTYLVPRDQSSVYYHTGDRLFDHRSYRAAFGAYYRSLYESINNPDFTGYRGQDDAGQADDHLRRGLQLAAAGKYQDAISEWNTANNMNSTFNRPRFSEPTFFIGCAYFAQRRLQLARNAWIAVLPIRNAPPPTDPGPDTRQIEAVHFLATLAYPRPR